jgi:NAD(P)-dependent dehydrogenase (short-subunit alcohol dehydrogenase family)
MAKTVIITGGAGRLGKAVIRKFLEADWQVLATVEPGTTLEPQTGLTVFELDVLNETACEDFVKKIPQTDACVMLVGGFALGNMAETKTADLEKMYHLNFLSAYHITRPVFEQMLRQGYGRLVFVGARPALLPETGQAMVAYSLSKSLIFNLSEILNAAGKDKNVVSAVVVPSTIDTPANRQGMPEADFKKWVAPEQIAGVIVFFCSDAGAILRETVLKVYGES